MHKYFLIVILVMAIPNIANALAECNDSRRGEIFVDTTSDVRAGQNETLVPLLCGDDGWQRLNNTVIYPTLNALDDSITGIHCGGILGENALSKGLTAIIEDIDGNGNSGQAYCDGSEWKNADGTPVGSGKIGNPLSEVLDDGNVASRDIDMNTQQITNLSDPSNDMDAANKRWVESKITFGGAYTIRRKNPGHPVPDDVCVGPNQILPGPLIPFRCECPDGFVSARLSARTRSSGSLDRVYYCYKVLQD